MVILYQFVLFIHISTAIIGFGQTFLFPLFLNHPKKEAEIVTTIGLLRKMGTIAKWSDWLLLSSGIALIALGHVRITDGWIILSLALFTLMRFSSSFISRKAAKAVWTSSDELQGEVLEKEFKKRVKSFIPRLWLTQIINFIIIFVMVFKPF